MNLLHLLIGFLELSAMPVIIFYWLVPGSLNKRDFELTLSAGYALIVVAIAVAGWVGGCDRASAVDQVRVSTACASTWNLAWCSDVRNYIFSCNFS